MRRSEHAFVAEGTEVLRTALAAGCVPESLYVAAEGTQGSGSGSHLGAVAEELVGRAAELGARVYELAPGVMSRVADTVTPQPVMSVFPMMDVPAVPTASRLVVVMADVRDPGNAGTLLRTADAAGADAVVCCGGTVDAYNPKTVRSSAGSIFHVPLVLAEDPASVLEELGPAGAGGLRRLGAVVRGGEDYVGIDWTVPTALVVGNEANGLPPTLPLDGVVAIPMAGRAESLNVGMACAVLCFEALRQRRTTMPR